jgi:alpha-L-fucosidase
MSGFDILKETVTPEAGMAVKEVFFTRQAEALNAITPLWPGRELIIRGVRAGKGSRVTWLATGQTLEWKNKGENLVIALPEFDPNALPPELQYAYVFRIDRVRE